MIVWLVEQAGYDYDKESFDQVFRRIYSIFGSAAPYTLYPDAQPFLRWVRKQGILVGIVSNASYRYRDIILPTLGLNKVSSALCLLALSNLAFTYVSMVMSMREYQ
jgi:phosphoglycolate phosphatase-like HAD superfamily hydrolase